MKFKRWPHYLGVSGVAFCLGTRSRHTVFVPGAWWFEGKKL